MSSSKYYKKNDEIEIEITDIGTNGEGIGHLTDGYTLFVQKAVPGDIVLAHIIKAQKNYGIARLTKIIKPSENRIKPICPVADKCGGCQIANIDYEKQLWLKENKVRELLIRVGGFDKSLVDNILHPIVGYFDEKENGKYIHHICEYGNTPQRFRNKAQYPIGVDKEGNTIVGFYSAHSHRIVPTTDCYIGADSDAGILKAILEYMSIYHIPAYDETEQKGLLRHVLIRTGYFTGEIQVCLVINGSDVPEKKALAELLLKSEPRIKSICLSPNTANTNVIMGDSYKAIYGNDYIVDEIGGVSFRISPLSFFQVNPVQTGKLYDLALEAAGLTGKEIVWDLYCGIGTISLFLAKKAKEVYGVEIVPQAIQNAKENAELNGINNAHFVVGKAEEVLPNFYNGRMDAIDGMKVDVGSGVLSPDVIVVDPPRKGCDEACLNTMLQMAPKRIVYVSCDPATLARDLKLLCESGKYSVCSVTPVDMFSNSTHVENVCLLSRKP